MMILLFKKLIYVYVSLAAGQECNWEIGASFYQKKRGTSFSPPKVPGVLLLQNLDLMDTSTHVRFYVHRLVYIYIKTYFPEFCSNIFFNSPFWFFSQDLRSISLARVGCKGFACKWVTFPRYWKQFIEYLLLYLFYGSFMS